MVSQEIGSKVNEFLLSLTLWLPVYRPGEEDAWPLNEYARRGGEGDQGEGRAARVHVYEVATTAQEVGEDLLNVLWELGIIILF